VTNSPEVATTVAKRCVGGRRHIHVISGRAKHAKVCPQALRRAACEAANEADARDVRTQIVAHHKDAQEMMKRVRQAIQHIQTEKLQSGEDSSRKAEATNAASHDEGSSRLCLAGEGLR
jgi:hypothetical protein